MSELSPDLPARHIVSIRDAALYTLSEDAKTSLRVDPANGDFGVVRGVVAFDATQPAWYECCWFDAEDYAADGGGLCDDVEKLLRELHAENDWVPDADHYDTMERCTEALGHEQGTTGFAVESMYVFERPPEAPVTKWDLRKHKAVWLEAFVVRKGG